MRYIKIIGILAVALLVNCKLYEELEEAMAETKLAEDSASEVAKSVAEEISKLTGLGLEEVKALTEEDLKRIAGDAEKDSGESRGKVSGEFDNGRRNSVDLKKAPGLVNLVKDSARKVEEAFKTLVNAGYGGEGVASVVGSNIEEACKLLSLLDKLTQIAVGDGGNKKADMSKVLEEFDKTNPGIDACGYMNSNKHSSQDRESKKCIKDLMKRVENLLYGGVENELRNDLSKPSSTKFNDPLVSLIKATSALSGAAGMISAVFS
ncbi:hypothetical protein DB313_05200 (plasmid) [Borrelia turcica IST7]|uniref:Uncharacterized protein n=1 Tax=Borrelia turcica IST7 TaxID=1104446 RepID=A0A386PMZ0_9SPIR|nr:hypothetical protein [Borrelia turcica]AYE36896.1 hypothetical protein DB313_05200 [Borrelia turcica IST7]